MIRLPSTKALEDPAEKERQRRAASDQKVQGMLDALQIGIPGGYRSTGSKFDAGRFELADTTVNIFPDMAGGLGHAGMAVGRDPSKGFYPFKAGKQAVIGFVPGEVREDDMTRRHQSITYPTTLAQEAAIRRSMATHSRDPYNLVRENCLEWVRARMKDGGVVTTPPLAPVPNAFIETQKHWIK